MIKYEVSYCKDTNLTFIMKYEYVGNTDQLKSMEVIAFYCGKPEQDTTNYYIENPSTKYDLYSID